MGRCYVSIGRSVEYSRDLSLTLSKLFLLFAPFFESKELISNLKKVRTHQGSEKKKEERKKKRTNNNRDIIECV